MTILLSTLQRPNEKICKLLWALESPGPNKCPRLKPHAQASEKQCSYKRRWHAHPDFWKTCKKEMTK